MGVPGLNAMSNTPLTEMPFTYFLWDWGFGEYCFAFLNYNILALLFWQWYFNAYGVPVPCVGLDGYKIKIANPYLY